MIFEGFFFLDKRLGQVTVREFFFAGNSRGPHLKNLSDQKVLVKDGERIFEMTLAGNSRGPLCKKLSDQRSLVMRREKVFYGETSRGSEAHILKGNSDRCFEV